MDKKIKKLNALRQRRKQRVRSRISGTEERPRLSVFRSSKHIFAQVIDDKAGKTLVSASTFEKGSRLSANIPGCEAIGKVIAERCQAKNITTIVFDKNASLYHGRVKALADSARANGLKF
ncbi:MAG: 50S ribosomal protein L18 [Zetaproteobacteria bacterium]|nr:50S ribosomal protein L18 [Zetaproteobacteria bacterium]